MKTDDLISLTGPAPETARGAGVGTDGMLHGTQ